MNRWVAFFLVSLVAAGAMGAPKSQRVETYAQKVSSLIDPAKLKTLGERGANPRVQKYVAVLAEAKAEGLNPKELANRAVALLGMKGQAAQLTADAMVRNVKIADQLGCLGTEGLGDMRRGQAPKVTRGPYKGDELSVDHIIPVAVVPELDKVIANLELMPLKMNAGKGETITERQVELARKLRKARLLSKQGLKAVESAATGGAGRKEPAASNQARAAVSTMDSLRGMGFTGIQRSRLRRSQELGGAEAGQNLLPNLTAFLTGVDAFSDAFFEKKPNVYAGPDGLTPFGPPGDLSPAADHSSTASLPSRSSRAEEIFHD